MAYDPDLFNRIEANLERVSQILHRHKEGRTMEERVTDHERRIARLEGAFEQMNRRLARIENEILIVIGSVWALIVAVLVKKP
jgi:hypothetical protein